MPDVIDMIKHETTWLVMAIAGTGILAIDNSDSDVVRNAITAVLAKTPSQSSRAVKAKQLGNTILEKIINNQQFTVSFDTFSLELVELIKGSIRSESMSYIAKSSKRQKLWSVLHSIRMKDTLSTIWNKFVIDLRLDIDDPLFEQSLYQEVF